MSILVAVFVIGYLLIAAEHFVGINKTATALLTGVLCWVLYAYGLGSTHLASETLVAKLGDVSGILFFLMGAMTIVELVDAHGGFEVITRAINTRDKVKLLWICSVVAFFLSSVLDNLTTTIVMISLMRRIIPDRETRALYTGLVIIAANAGGAWTPIGDVTTTMLWIGGQVTTAHIMKSLFLPSVICLLVPLVVLSFRLKGSIDDSPGGRAEERTSGTTSFEKRLVFFLGVGGLVFVPVFKTLTHLPPFMGMLFSLSVLWLATELMHKQKDEEARHHHSITRALQRIDMTSVLFFLGILLAINTLELHGTLRVLAQWLDRSVGNIYAVNTVIGLSSAIIDNVPLVAASMGMYPLSQFPVNAPFWELLAYCAGTGGSILIIGSAAGVAAMGMERLEFFWYVRKISPWAALGYFSGIGWILLEKAVF
jgi:Na+/H+ antiporter NhaD/arsenite permease-like protein